MARHGSITVVWLSVLLLVASKTPGYDFATSECDTFACDFESGDFCNYRSTADETNRIAQHSAAKWQILRGNRRSIQKGSKSAAVTNYYAAAYLAAQQGALLQSKDLFVTAPSFLIGTYHGDRVIKFRVHKTSDSISLFGCCNHLGNCPYRSGGKGKAKPYKWKVQSFACKSRLRKVLFYAVNEQSDHGGKSFVALDDIRVLYPANYPNRRKAGRDICEFATKKVSNSRLVNTPVEPVTLPSRPNAAKPAPPLAATTPALRWVPLGPSPVHTEDALPDRSTTTPAAATFGGFPPDNSLLLRQTNVENGPSAPDDIAPSILKTTSADEPSPVTTTTPSAAMSATEQRNGIADPEAAEEDDDDFTIVIIPKQQD